ncbi:MAG TPA: DUF4304 domain-containing protein [Tepidisphaeraceae bacterium]|nr:DUF4304 domain-containing protein [Tepidisphaeraceae bacterium]
MAEASHYTWDFERPAADIVERFDTFSVGIFQWLPKASGKGMKMSKGIARVLGYTAEPERVYEKAVQICARLNREGAKVDAPPDWLQKQYSIPRPAGMVVERTSNDFTAAQVRAMRLGVMKEHLLPAGFIVGKDASYVRRRGEMIHLINFQASKHGHEFTVNLGFHYSFVPPLFQMVSLPLSGCMLLDCIIHDRIGRYFPPGRDKWFEYGTDAQVLKTNLLLCAKTSLEVYDRWGERWSDPASFLEDTIERTWIDPLAAACVELRLGRFDQVKKRLDEWKDDRYPEPPALHVWLRKKVMEAEQQSGAGKQVSLPDWIAAAKEAENHTLWHL